MRQLFSLRRSLLAASTLLLVASSSALLTPEDASAKGSRFLTYGLYTWYSDASHTTSVGQCHINYHCINGRVACWGTQTDYYTAEVISYC